MRRSYVQTMKEWNPRTAYWPCSVDSYSISWREGPRPLVCIRFRAGLYHAQPPRFAAPTRRGTHSRPRHTASLSKRRGRRLCIEERTRIQETAGARLGAAALPAP